jgi:hypothetical protein
LFICFSSKNIYISIVTYAANNVIAMPPDYALCAPSRVPAAAAARREAASLSLRNHRAEDGAPVALQHGARFPAHREVDPLAGMFVTAGLCPDVINII